ncbi:MAG: ABC transporter permease [Ilumatobacteraceae bacterium]
MTAAAPALVLHERRSVHWWRIIGRYGAILVLLTMILVMSILETDAFATKDNLINVLNQSALTAIIAIGLTFPLVAGEFDLSVGYQASFAGVLVAGLMERSGLSIPVAIVVVVLIGVLIGLTNGLIVTRVGVNALVTTLGVGTIVVGLNYAYTSGLPQTLKHPRSFINLTFKRLLGIPYPVYIALVLAAMLWFLLNRTATGQAMQAVGGNAEAARLSGIRVNRIRVLTFVIASVCAAVGGVLLASRTGSGAVDGGDGYLLSAFAATFFGSAVLRDGQFHIVGTLIGVFTVSVGFNAMAILGLDTYYQFLFQGTLLILAVGVGTIARRLALR